MVKVFLASFHINPQNNIWQTTKKALPNRKGFFVLNGRLSFNESCYLKEMFDKPRKVIVQFDIDTVIGCGIQL